MLSFENQGHNRSAFSKRHITWTQSVQAQKGYGLVIQCVGDV